MDQASFWLIAAMLVQGALAIGLLFHLGTIRVPMIIRGEVRIGDIALDRGGWPERERRVSNAVDNQFQLPVLFYLAGVAAILLGTNWLDVALAWIFVVTRYIHAFIHVTDNNVVRRFWAFTAGLAVLALFWLVLAIQLAGAAIGG